MMLVCSALLVAAVAIDNPILLGTIAACALALLLAGPGSKRAYLIFAGTSALLVFLINPFVSVQGLTPIWHGPHIPLLDTEITQEELAFGAGAALRIFASALAVAAFVRIADGDLVLNGVSRVAPRSAMIVALAARLLPTLERDAAGIALAARARGATASGRRSAADLVSPLVSLSLERSLGLAEAMEARGYGGRQRTREPGPPADGVRGRALPADRLAAAPRGRELPVLRPAGRPGDGGRDRRVGCVRRADRGRHRGGAMAAMSFTDVRY